MTADFERDSFGRRVVRAPGMADDLLQQLAPLLAESGIDLANGSHTVEEVNAALANAAERHNLILTTPVGKSLAAVFDRIAVAVDQIFDGDIETFIEEVSSLHPDEEPTPAQVIGVCLGRLDDWYANPGTRKKLTGVDLSNWQDEDRRAIGEILELARQGRAFASYRELLLEHGGARASCLCHWSRWLSPSSPGATMTTGIWTISSTSCFRSSSKAPHLSDGILIRQT